MRPGDLPWRRFFSGDFLKETQGMTLEEIGAYILLLCRYWTVLGPIPDDDKRLRAMAHATKKEWARIGPIVKKMFVTENGYLRHHEMDKEIVLAQARYEKARIAALTKHGKLDKSAANGMPKQAMSTFQALSKRF